MNTEIITMLLGFAALVGVQIRTTSTSSGNERRRENMSSSVGALPVPERG